MAVLVIITTLFPILLETLSCESASDRHGEAQKRRLQVGVVLAGDVQGAAVRRLVERRPPATQPVFPWASMKARSTALMRD